MLTAKENRRKKINKEAPSRRRRPKKPSWPKIDDESKFRAASLRSKSARSLDNGLGRTSKHVECDLAPRTDVQKHRR